ncbi:unnamed protein product [Ilex paraguariensis]|uniref:Kinesin motor domain-containing protein n=1 Tax=Ilex paraguariensis TaxID=185542 RepID=A0ABC8SQB3_9AQUA
MNDRSSRSHSCVKVHVRGRDLTSGTILHGCLHLVDLAGSERVDKSEVVGDRLKEAQHINKSLSALGDVISSLGQKNSHVPYRNSKLTQLLQDSLGGQAKALMFVHISPDPDATGETLSTLKFAERVSTVELGVAQANKDSPDVRKLKEQIASLKAALARKEGTGHLQQSRSNSAERLGVMFEGNSPSHPNWQSAGDMSGNSMQPMEDVGNVEVRNNYGSKVRRQSFDLQNFLINSPPWPPAGSPRLQDDKKEIGFGNWIDKVMVNKQDGVTKYEKHLRGWEEDSSRSPEMFCQRYSLDSSKIDTDKSVSRFSGNRKESQDHDVNRNRHEMAIISDSDDLEAATSDSSEVDFTLQLNTPEVMNVSNGVASKIKRPSPKQTKRPEISRSLIPAPPSRRLSIGGNSTFNKTERQSISADGKRKTGSGK